MDLPELTNEELDELSHLAKYNRSGISRYFLEISKEHRKNMNYIHNSQIMNFEIALSINLKAITLLVINLKKLHISR